MTYLQAKVHLSSYSDSLVMAIKLNAKYRFHAAAIVVLHFSKQTPWKCCIFFKDLIPYIISRQYVKCHSVVSTSQVYASSMLFSWIARNLKYDFGVISNGVMSMTCDNRSTYSETERWHMCTYRHMQQHGGLTSLVCFLKKEKWAKNDRSWNIIY